MRVLILVVLVVLVLPVFVIGGKQSQLLLQPTKVGSGLLVWATFDGRRSLMVYDLRRKTTFNGRRPSIEDKLRWKTTFDGRRPLCSSSIFPARAIDHTVLYSIGPSWIWRMEDVHYIMDVWDLFSGESLAMKCFS